MIKQIYSIYDSVADEFGAPVIFNNDAQACRAFDREITNNKDIYSPGDYRLYNIGIFSMETGEITSLSPCVVDTNKYNSEEV